MTDVKDNKTTQTKSPVDASAEQTAAVKTLAYDWAVYFGICVALATLIFGVPSLVLKLANDESPLWTGLWSEVLGWLISFPFYVCARIAALSLLVDRLSKFDAFMARAK